MANELTPAASATALEADAMSDTAKAREAIAELMKLCGIDKAVLVDDEPLDIEASDIEIVIEQSGKRALDNLGGEFATIDIADSAETWKESLLSVWSSLPPEEKAAAFRRLQADKDMGLDARFGQPATLHLLPDGAESLAPAEWEERKHALVRDRIGEYRGRKHCKTLVLFDLDLSKAPGGMDKGGDRLLKSLINENPEIDIVCGVVSSYTGHYTPEDAKSGLPAGMESDRIVLIDKATLPDKPWVFAQGLKKALLAPDVVSLKRRAKALLEEANNRAMDELTTVDLFDLTYALITRSDLEGVPEWETLFRLHRIFLNDHLRRAAIYDVELRSRGDNLRQVAATAPAANLTTDIKTWRLQRRDVIDNARDINELHLPTNVGDVFEFETGGQSVRYVLLSSACDLMIRPTGRRRLERGLLVKLSTNAAKSEESVASHVIPYFSETEGESIRALFAESATANLWTLDLCVLNADGRAFYQEGAAVPAFLSPGWKKRAEAIARRCQAAIARLPKSGGKIVAQVIPAREIGELIQKANFTPTPSVLALGCRRIQRLKPAYAADLVTRFGQYISRAAFEMDLGVGTAAGFKESADSSFEGPEAPTT